MATKTTDPQTETAPDEAAPAENEAMRPDETVPGGRYELANGSFVDANGNPIED